MSQDFDNDNVSIFSGHPSLGEEMPGWRTAGWVGLARTLPCEDDQGKVTIDINFEPAFVTVREAATLLRVTPSAVRRLIQHDKLDVRQFDTEHRITWESLTVLADIRAGAAD